MSKQLTPGEVYSDVATCGEIDCPFRHSHKPTLMREMPSEGDGRRRVQCPVCHLTLIFVPYTVKVMCETRGVYTGPENGAKKESTDA
uniref:Uncharacterized protein n=1 Tax=viral metagenome TaxID=1070528 RepID=A0A6M3Y1U5_9ZZZZ